MHLTLDVEYDYDFSLIAISCFEWEYRLAWLINKAIDTDLVRVDDLEMTNKDSQSSHPVYVGSHFDGEATLTLIKNREEDGILMPELAQIDFLLKAENYQDSEEDLMASLRKIPQIQAAFLIDVNQLKHKEYLITD